MEVPSPTKPQDQPPAQRRSESIDPSKLTVRQIFESMTLGQIYGVITVVVGVLVTVATSSYKLGATWSSPMADDHSATVGSRVLDSSASPAVIVPIQPGTIIATHYPTGELFAVEPKHGTLRLLSARLGQPSGMVIRASGEIIVLDSEHNLILGVNPETGYHRYVGAYLWPSQGQALALESENSALVALDGALIRVDLESGRATTVASSDLLRGASGVVRMPSGEIVVTAIPDKILKVNSTDGSTVVLSEGDHLWHPRAPTVENSRSVLVGTAGRNAGVPGILRVNLQTGAQELVATGPFTTVAGMAIESNGSILVADNGRGAPGDGFLARLDPTTRRVSILVSAQTSDWKFLNGRSIVIFPGANSR